jgi:hypothetical protein
MKIFDRSTQLFCSLLLVLFASTLRAEQYETFGDYQIHYIAFSSELLQPEIARQYELERARNRAVLNISVLKTEASGSNKAVSAAVRGSFTNLAQQKQTLNFKRVVEGDAIYYLASLRFTDQETLKFDIEFQPDTSEPVRKLSFSQQLYFEPKK